jgi:hypothetical protein
MRVILGYREVWWTLIGAGIGLLYNRLGALAGST